VQFLWHDEHDLKSDQQRKEIKRSGRRKGTDMEVQFSQASAQCRSFYSNHEHILVQQVRTPSLSSKNDALQMGQSLSDVFTTAVNKAAIWPRM